MYSHSCIRTRSSRSTLIATLVSCVSLVAGCATLARLQEDNQSFYNSTVLVGRVHGASPGVPVRVFAAREAAGRAVEHDVYLHYAGGFELVVPDGRYRIGAFEDRDGDGRLGSNEPAGMYPEAVEVVRSGLITAIDVRIAPDRDAAVARLLPTDWRSQRANSTQVAALADLSSPLFSTETGADGYWAPLKSFKERGGNLYAFEAADRTRIPVVLVHGAQGSAQDWRQFVERLAETRYQPFVFQYPSGAPVDSMADLLYWKLLNLELRYGYGEIHLVAHSMGGLVVQRLLADHGAELPQIRSVTTLATPWNGVRSASAGVRHSPAVVPSWRDVDPNGRFVSTLFARTIPEYVRHLLIYTYRNPSGLWSSAATDGTVTLKSQLRTEAQQQATRVQGIEADHAGVLSSDEAFQAVLTWLTEASDFSQGAVEIELRHGGSLTIPMGVVPTLLLTGDDRRATVHALDFTADKTVVRGVREGRYTASIIVPGFGAAPQHHELVVQAGRTTFVTVTVEPQGTLMGRIFTAVSDAVTLPAGSLKSIESTVDVAALRLEGNGEVRYVVPSARGNLELLSSYAAGRDDATRSAFAFVGLSAGEYRLTVEFADGREVVTRHRVTPGDSGAHIVVRMPATH
jgi:pimeloyl-ACP methyl ester carboxylesterase